MGEVIGYGKAEDWYALRMWRDSISMLTGRSDRYEFTSLIEKEKRIYRKELSEFCSR